jgi:hypothetical protein
MPTLARSTTCVQCPTCVQRTVGHQCHARAANEAMQPSQTTTRLRSRAFVCENMQPVFKRTAFVCASACFNSAAQVGARPWVQGVSQPHRAVDDVVKSACSRLLSMRFEMQFRWVSEQRPKLHALPLASGGADQGHGQHRHWPGPWSAPPLARAMVSTATGQDRGQHRHWPGPWSAPPLARTVVSTATGQDRGQHRHWPGPWSAPPLARTVVSTATGQDRGQHCHPKTDVPERARATFLCTSHWREQRIQASIRR